MSEPLKRKVEKAMTGYLQTFAGTDLDGLTIAEGHSADLNSLPILAVYAGTPELGDMPAETSIRNIAVDCQIHAAMEDADRAQLDDWIGCLETILSATDTVKAALNKTAVVDARTVTGVHFYDCFASRNESGRDGGVWIESVEASVVASLEDAF